MSEQAAQAWQALSEAFAKFVAHLGRSTSVNVNSLGLRSEAKSVAQEYLRRTRPALASMGLEDQVAELDLPFQTLFHLSEGRNAASSYRKQIKHLRKALPRVAGQLEMRLGAGQKNVLSQSETEGKIIGMLASLVPSAGLSYQQAIADLSDLRRISFRGPALELREALREVLDHLAPDDAVMKSDGFRTEKDRTKPTMKQKVRFILRARGQSKATTAVPEDMTTTVESLVGDLARSVYNQGSMVTHVAAEREAVLRLKRYVEVVLYDILAL
jgi:Predicted pPIWI-associating nuclease